MNTVQPNPLLLSIGLSSLTGDRPWWSRRLGETRTRILFLYAALMSLVGAISIPLFLTLFFDAVDTRVREDLGEDMEEVLGAYQTWEAAPNQDVEDLRAFMTDVFQNQRPEDDNFLLLILDGKIYRSNPSVLPAVLRTDPTLLQRWTAITEEVEGEYATDDPEIGHILYLADPLVLDGQIRGSLVAVHTTAGERQEALDGVVIFIKVATGVVVLSFALAWFITGQMLAPVQNLATTARSISESNLAHRIPVQGSGELADLTETFNEMMNRIQQAFTSQREFINDASHELRTPITIIRGHLELLGDDPDEQAETLTIVMGELDRMSRFVNDLLLLAKAERPDFLQPESIELSHFTEELFVKAQALAPRNWQIDSQSQGLFVGDRQRLTGAVLNLAQNATQHTQEHDLIELGSVIRDREVRFWVRDTGEGIAPSDHTRIFERFARLTKSYRRSDGAGLGLSIVRAIAEAHGGSVELISQPGQGSTFTVVFPLDPPQESIAP